MAATPIQGDIRPGLADYALLLLLAAVWGGSFMFIKIAVETMPPLTVTAARLLLAAVILVVAARAAGQTLVGNSSTWRLIFLSAVFGNALPFFLISWGEQEIDSGLAAILMAVMPLSTILLAHVFTEDEKLSLYKVLGVIFGVVGLAILLNPEKLALLGNETVRQLAVAAAALCYGINAIFLKKLAGSPRRVTAAAIITVSTLMLLPVCLYVDRPWQLTPSTGSLLAAISLGVMQTAVATLLMFAIIRRQGASFFSQINFLIPLVGVALGAVFLAERPGLNALLALVIILAGIAISRGGAAAKPYGLKAQERRDA